MKTATKKICSYSLGYMGQGAAYNFMSTYFIVFMTDCVGMSSTLSGSIMSIALLMEVIAGMTVGNLSDNCRSSPVPQRRRSGSSSAAATLLYTVFAAEKLKKILQIQDSEKILSDRAGIRLRVQCY